MPVREDIGLLASYNAGRGAFFGLVLGTLHHLVAGDTIWLRIPARMDT